MAASLIMYVLLFNHIFTFRRTARHHYVKWYYITNKITKLEEDFVKNQKEFDAIKYDSIYTTNNSTELAENNCNLDMQEIPKVDVQMLDLYSQLEFDNPYGGA
ncbi:hypothetical protein G9C98_000214 [Cotesia typhae]|uniref:Uncharacterized protein n=1 Tax=Cotesia typhae TaxID=2053667 RepID=A0A8J5QY21_9HYME|nr:hypothetical protein G9C98_000214 [Cotesia typhae]